MKHDFRNLPCTFFLFLILSSVDDVIKLLSYYARSHWSTGVLRWEYVNTAATFQFRAYLENYFIKAIEHCFRVYITSSKHSERGWRSGESARLPPIFPGFICELSLLLVLYSASRGFSPGTLVFPSPQESSFPNSNSILECTDISERLLLGSPWETNYFTLLFTLDCAGGG